MNTYCHVCYCQTKSVFSFTFQLPTNLLRAGRVFTFEPPPGVSANLLRTFSTIPATRMCKVRFAVKKLLCKKASVLRYELHHGTTGFLPMQKQRCRSTVQ